MTRVWVSASRPMATLAVAVPSSAPERRSERRWAPAMLATPSARHSFQQLCR